MHDDRTIRHAIEDSLIDDEFALGQLEVLDPVAEAFPLNPGLIDHVDLGRNLR
jgi:hypothetical protein